MKLGEIEFDENPVVVKSLENLLKGFNEDLQNIEETGKASGYISWDDVVADKKAIKKEIKSIVRVLKLYGIH